MRVFLTGSSGFVGSTIASNLTSQGVEVIKILSPGRTSNSSSNTITFVDFVENHSKISTTEPNAFIHCGWAGVAADDRNNPYQYQNISDSLRLFEIAINYDFKHFIFIGSQAEYKNTTNKINEKTQLEPTSKYGISKLFTYKLLDEYQKLKRRKILTHAILFDVYGPNDNPKWIIPTVIHHLKTNTIIELTAGEQIWNYLHVEDVANAISHLLTSTPLGIVNICSDNNWPLKSFLTIIAARLQKVHLLNFGEINHHSASRSIIGDNTKIKKYTNWCETISFEDGITKILGGDNDEI